VNLRGRIGKAGGLVVAAVLGAGLALGGAALFGSLGTKTTTIRELQAAVAPAASALPRTSGLSINDIYKRAAPGVVQVTSTSTVTVQPDPFFNDPFFGNIFPQKQTQQSLGSGFVVDKAGHIVTNYHVVSGAKQVRVSFSNGSSMKATIVGTDPSSDLAVLKIDASSRALTPLPLGDSDEARVGDSVVAIGNPFGLDRTVTAGIVSAIQRAITAPNGYTIDHVIQTDAAINHGNSGGPLLNSRGQVVGVNSQIETGSGGGGNVGIGFAVPSNTVRQIAPRLEQGQAVAHPYLGVQTTNAPGRAGALVTKSMGPAARAGIRPGDIITTVGGKQIQSPNDVAGAVDAHQVGESIGVEVIHPGGSREELHVALGDRPNKAGP
jgi:putative serine protease PepD